MYVHALFLPVHMFLGIAPFLPLGSRDLVASTWLKGTSGDASTWDSRPASKRFRVRRGALEPIGMSPATAGVGDGLDPLKILFTRDA